MKELRYLRQEHLPNIWCAGCGHGTVLGSVIRAMEKSGIDQDRTVVVSGIGCSSRTVFYLNMDTIHTTHGRALAFATGIKLARPDLKVIVMAGDGDLAAIGGNHLIHAARRNIGITCICLNNGIYGMTSGQYSPLTPAGYVTTTSPHGHVERDFDLCKLVQAAGATYVARSTAYHTQQTIMYVSRALAHDGFSFVEVLSQCPTYLGRRNRMADPVTMLEWFRDTTVMAGAAARMKPEELEGKTIIGEFHRTTGVPEYSRAYREMVARVSGAEMAQAGASGANLMPVGSEPHVE
ncbi:MAG: 2-oxoacid:ferredoxin oxidoreductase subunit beta [Armatimonadota bacterium]|nr:2-oxoacid:ferredoxin oxidoreductase subunit beta [Armatimonadota bacterium]